MAHYHGVGGNLSVVEYIESTGTQYIDTGFKPNQNTRVVAEMAYVSCTDNTCGLFGCGSVKTNDQWFEAFYYNGQYCFNFGRYPIVHKASLSLGQKMSIDVSIRRAVFVVNDVIIDVTPTEAQTFIGECTLTIHAMNRGNSIGHLSRSRTYSLKIYDNGTLVRDYIPCVNPDGVAGLFDKVGKKFYGNAGTGTFAIGATTGEIINYSVGMAREVIKRYRGIDGVARNIKKTYHEVDGVAREYFSNGTPIGDLAVGSSVYMNVNGVATEFLVVQQGRSSEAAYDSSCDGTWLLMKNCYESRAYDDTSSQYGQSDIHSYLNNTFINLFDSQIINTIKNVKLPYSYKQYGNWMDGSLYTRVFLLSYFEVWTQADPSSGGNNISTEGYYLDYFVSPQNRIATLNGVATNWFTRAPDYNNEYYICVVKADGSLSKEGYSTVSGIRPALILPFETRVDKNSNVIAK